MTTTTAVRVHEVIDVDIRLNFNTCRLVIKCVGLGAVRDGGSGGPPPENVDLVDVISCILVHFWDGPYLKNRSDS